MEAETIEVEDEPETWTDEVPEEVSYQEQLTFLLSTYGWFLFLGGFLTFVAWRKWIQPRYERWQDDQHAARYHKDPDVALARMKAVEAARLRLQAEHDALAAAHAEKTRQREEQRRKEKIDEYEQRLNGAPNSAKKLATSNEASTSTTAPRKPTGKPRLRNNDYNPLMGAGGSSGYRPSSRSCFGSPRGGA